MLEIIQAEVIGTSSASVPAAPASTPAASKPATHACTRTATVGPNHPCLSLSSCKATQMHLCHRFRRDRCTLLSMSLRVHTPQSRKSSRSMCSLFRFGMDSREVRVALHVRACTEQPGAVVVSCTCSQLQSLIIKLIQFRSRTAPGREQHRMQQLA